MNTNTEHINIFIAYSRKDEDHLGELRTTLTPLERRYESVNIWFDGKIDPGKDWNKSIKKHLHEAHIILLLVSMDSLASEYFYNEEMQDALKRHESGEAIVIPIILRVCDWKEELIGTLQALPKDGVPVTKWGDKDDAYFDILNGIKQSIKTIQSRQEATKKAEEERIRREKEEKKVNAEKARQVAETTPEVVEPTPESVAETAPEIDIPEEVSVGLGIAEGVETPVMGTATPEKPKTDAKPDKFTKIEGIGPKLTEKLNNAGILSFKDLSCTSLEKLQEVLDAAGPRYGMHDPGTWAEQAALAADSKWDELKALQDELEGGKRVK